MHGRDYGAVMMKFKELQLTDSQDKNILINISESISRQKVVASAAVQTHFNVGMCACNTKNL
jgi:hypothetical protein